MKKNKIVFIHQFNNYSGSPLVLSHVIEVAKNKFNFVELITNHGTGFLSNLDCKTAYIPYSRSNYKLLTLISFLLYQVQIFFKILSYKNQKVIIYINTTMPFFAGIAGKILGKKVIFHFHETSLNEFQTKIIRSVICLTSNKNIFVSKDLYKKEEMKSIESKIIYNTLSKDFAENALSTQYKMDKNIYVLMICSLRKYKGINQFIKIANLCSQKSNIKFELVVDATKNDIDKYFMGIDVPTNVKIFGSTNNIQKHYCRANILLNLTLKKERIETFGMTILEGMAYGIPAIVPTEGGPTELIEDQISGYHIDSEKTKEISKVILHLNQYRSNLIKLSVAARKRFYKFDFSFFEKSFNRFFNELDD